MTEQASGSNLARVLAIWGELTCSGAMEPLVDAMAEDVVWRGLRPELVCRGRAEVARVLASTGTGRLARVTHMEAEEVGDRVVLTVEGPDFPSEPAGTAPGPPGGPRTLVLTFEADKVVRLESFATRDAGLRAKT